MNDARWRDKGDAFATAWVHRFAVLPTVHAVALGVSVAQHETWCGDAWPGPDGMVGTEDDENNWGACTLRALDASERAILTQAGLTPTVGPDHKARAEAAMKALDAAGLPRASGDVAGIHVPSATIHCDSAPGKGAYFVWFANFKTPADGAEYFIHLLAEGKPARAVLENPKGDAQSIAAAMYSRGYFTGFFNPKAWYVNGHEVPAGTEGAITGAQANVNAYAKDVAAIFPGVLSALANWTPTIGPIPPAPPVVPSFDLRKGGDIQRALNALGCGRPFLADDGDLGDLTTAALGFYAGGTLEVDGVTPLDVIPYDKGTKHVRAAILHAMSRDLRALNFTVIDA